MKPTFILLVEDEPVVACDLRIELELAGCRVLTAHDAATALALCSRHLPDAAILNFHFKTQLDGMELARLLRIHYLMPVLFITGARREDLEASGYFYAGVEVLHKPFTRHQLKDFLLTLRGNE